MTDREKGILEILRREIRLVIASDDECPECGECTLGTVRVKEGNLEHIAKLIADGVSQDEKRG